MKQNWVIPLTALLVLLADYFGKQWALANLHEGVLTPFLPGLLQLTLTTNTGGAFGIGHQYKYIMTALPILICIAIIVWIVKRTRSGFQLSLWEQIAYGMVLGGAGGNICERLYRGHVTDFIDFAFMDFPIFNIADSLIDVGVAIIVLHSVFSKPPGTEQISPSAASSTDETSANEQ
jgi:signal peptidase II